MAYAVENALFEWEEGERRVLDAPLPRRAALELTVEQIREELRRRLGSTFTIEELAAFYGEGVDWADELAHGELGGDDSWLIEAAFARYAREASDFAGGRRRI